MWPLCRVDWDFYFPLFSKILFIYFLERGDGRVKERERNINVWSPLVCSLLGTWFAFIFILK